MFNRSSFSPVSFSRISFAGAQAADEARSGYWRLFFTQMQEDALKKRDEDEKPVTKVETSPEPHVQVKIKPRKKLEPLVPLETYEKPSFKRKPIYATQEVTQVPADQWQSFYAISLEVDTWLSVLIPQWESRKVELLQIKKVEAVNDADYRVRLLLLAA